jgi:hypothetical protein
MKYRTFVFIPLPGDVALSRFWHDHPEFSRLRNAVRDGGDHVPAARL